MAKTTIKAKCDLTQGQTNGSTVRFVVNATDVPAPAGQPSPLNPPMRVADTVINMSFKDPKKYLSFENQKEYTITIE